MCLSYLAIVGFLQITGRKEVSYSKVSCLTSFKDVINGPGGYF